MVLSAGYGADGTDFYCYDGGVVEVSMDDGATWSAQADFIARLSDWDESSDSTWPFHRAERSALLALNVPHFVLPSDGHDVRDFEGPVATLVGPSGLDRARENFAEARPRLGR